MAPHGDDLVIAVADGLGHGPDAALASERAIEMIARTPGRDLATLFGEIDLALYGTRGVALTVVRLALGRGILTHAAIGNVETRLYPKEGTHPVYQPGVLGLNRRQHVRVREHRWPPGGTLVMFSDGIGRRWSLDDDERLMRADPAVSCRVIAAAHAVPRDDASLIVVGERPW